MNEVTPEQVVQYLLLQAEVYPHLEELLATAATLIENAYFPEEMDDA